MPLTSFLQPGYKPILVKTAIGWANMNTILNTQCPFCFVLFCFQQALHLPTIRNKSNSRNQPEVTGFLPFMVFHTLGNRKSKYGILKAAQRQREDRALSLGRLVRHKPDLLVAVCGKWGWEAHLYKWWDSQRSNSNLITSDKNSAESGSAGKKIWWLISPPPLTIWAPLLTQIQNLGIFEKPSLLIASSFPSK